MIKVDIVSGFLGAGKTTFIKHILKEKSNEKIALIENEFGEIGIDGGFLKDSGIQIQEINSGCICCSLVGDLKTAISELIKKYSLDRIIIEPSGVGKLSDIISAILSAKEIGLEINTLVTVVDATKIKMYTKNFGEFFINQIANANTIITTRTDKISNEKILEAVDIIRDMNGHAKIITTPIAELGSEKLLDIIENKDDFMAKTLEEAVMEHNHDEDEECECHHHDEDEECECHHHHHHDADEIFESFGLETPLAFSKNKLESILNTLSNTETYGIIIRSKGMVLSNDNKWYHFDLVPNEYEIREGSPEYTGKICVIGSKLNKDSLKNLFLKDEEK